jgi:diaminopropionate ammonia-lyase
MDIFLAPKVLTDHTPESHRLAALNRSGRQQVERFLQACPMHKATPLHRLSALSAQLGLQQLHVKDESQRLGLGSFKALGGAYAVMKLVLEIASQSLGRQLKPDELLLPQVRAIASGITVACATDGNHGRSVAAGAKLCGCQAQIFVHEHVSPARSAAMVELGASVVCVHGGYDDSVIAAAQTAHSKGWHIVSDTAYEGYESIPLTVMQGYTVMAGEAFDALQAEYSQPPTHLFLQAGVGGMAAAVAAHALAAYGAENLPRIVVVEPIRAACLAASARAGKIVSVPSDQPTLMAMLECHTPSLIAWDILQALTSAYVSLEEEEALEGILHFADAGIEGGESGAAGYAGLIACLSDARVRDMLELNHQSRVLVFNTEGATDTTIYADLLQRARYARTNA